MALGIPGTAMNPALMVHGLASDTIERLTTRDMATGAFLTKFGFEGLKRAALFGNTVKGVVEVAKGVVERGQELLREKTSGEEKDVAAKVEPKSTAATGGPQDPGDDEKKKGNITQITQGKSQAPEISEPNSIYEQMGDDDLVKSRTFYDGRFNMTL